MVSTNDDKKSSGKKKNNESTQGTSKVMRPDPLTVSQGLPNGKRQGEPRRFNYTFGVMRAIEATPICQVPFQSCFFFKKRNWFIPAGQLPLAGCSMLEKNY